MAEVYDYRQLTAADTDLARELLRIFGDAFEDHASYQRAVPSEAYLTRLLAKDHFIVLVALNEGNVVGGMVAYVLDKIEQERREIYIYDLAVLDHHRRRRVATGLIERLRAIAAGLEAYVIFVQADLEDAPAIALYKSLGIQETAHHFDIAVHKSQPSDQS